jgi:hypothetical protein
VIMRIICVGKARRLPPGLDEANGESVFRQLFEAVVRACMDVRLLRAPQSYSAVLVERSNMIGTLASRPQGAAE